MFSKGRSFKIEILKKESKLQNLSLRQVVCEMLNVKRREMPKLQSILRDRTLLLLLCLFSALFSESWKPLTVASFFSSVAQQRPCL